MNPHLQAKLEPTAWFLVTKNPCRLEDRDSMEERPKSYCGFLRPLLAVNAGYLVYNEPPGLQMGGIFPFER